MRSAALLVVILLCSCVSTVESRGSLPAPPDERALKNDGSPDEQRALQRKYEVVVSGEKVRIGDGRRPARGGLLGTQLHPDLAGYISDTVIDGYSTKRTATAVAGVALFAGSVAAAILVLPIPLLGGLLAVSAMEIIGRIVVAQPFTRRASIPLGIITAIHGTLFVSWLVGLVVWPSILMQIGGIVMFEQAFAGTRRAAERAAAIYNNALAERIREASPDGAHPAAPAPESAPAAEPDPASPPALPDDTAPTSSEAAGPT